MDMTTSIASSSVTQHQQRLMAGVSSSLMVKAMDQNKQAVSLMLEVMESPALRPGGMDLRV